MAISQISLKLITKIKFDHILNNLHTRRYSLLISGIVLILSKGELIIII